MHSSVLKLLSFLLPSPVAYIIASVLLAETHFLWTAHTILPRDQVRLVPKRRDRQGWKSLVIPALIYAKGRHRGLYELGAEKDPSELHG